MNISFFDTSFFKYTFEDIFKFNFDFIESFLPPDTPLKFENITGRSKKISCSEDCGQKNHEKSCLVVKRPMVNWNFQQNSLVGQKNCECAVDILHAYAHATIVDETIKLSEFSSGDKSFLLSLEDFMALKVFQTFSQGKCLCFPNI